MASISFKDEGIARTIKEGNLFVPPNQREYAWEEKHVRDLYEDIADAMAKGSSEYFLGSIVVAKHQKGGYAVYDGQQRLATITILLAAIRDYYAANSDPERAGIVETAYLTGQVLNTLEKLPKLKLSQTDNEFFLNRIILRADETRRKEAKPQVESHEKIEKAAEIAKKHVQNIVSSLPATSRAGHLSKWVSFVEAGVRLICVEVPDDRSAYVIFETMNDRGLHLSMADLLKNHLFGLADDRMPEVEKSWYAMVGALETVQEEDILVTFIRHLWISTHGPTRSKQLFDQMKEHVKSKQGAIDLAKQLEAQAPRYAALLNPMHSMWNDFDGSVRKNVQTLANLRMEQVRPLLLAVTQRFTKAEVRTCLLALACWSVRFLITGVGSGTLEGHYGRNALEVWNGKIKDTSQLTNALISIIPNDDAFQSSFSTARVSQARLARYYLRALQQNADGEKEPHYVPNEGPEINLEHILPKSPGANWKHVDVETARAYTNRIGNLALLQATPNDQIGDSDFKTKKGVFQSSEYSLTKEVATFTSWGAGEISQRQQRLAKLALETWPLKPK